MYSAAGLDSSRPERARLVLFPDTGRAVVRLLERLGHQVEFLPGQTCFGQMHFNTAPPARTVLAAQKRFVRFRPVLR